MVTASTELACFGGPATLDPAMLRSAPILDEHDARTAYDIVLNGQIEPVGGPHNAALAREWAEFFDARHCLPTQSGMMALQAAYVAAGIKPGDHVLVTALTFTATASAVRRVGAVPVFVDTRPDTYEMDLDDARRKITPQTTAIVAVHVHGLPCDMTAVTAFADEMKLILIEDAAQAPGALYDNLPMGSWGAATAHSHSRGKPVMAGAGGELTTNDDKIWERVRCFAQQGETHRCSLAPGEHRAYECDDMYCDNVRMGEPTAALVRGQLKRLPDYLQRARANAQLLTAGLAELPGIIPPVVPANRQSSWTYYRFALDLDTLSNYGPTDHARDQLFWALHHQGAPVTTWLLLGLDRHRGARKRPDGTLAPINRDWCPQAQQTLDTTLVLGAAPHMLQVQDTNAVHAIIGVFEHVFDPNNLTRILKADHQPLKIPSRVSAAEA